MAGTRLLTFLTATALAPGQALAQQAGAMPDDPRLLIAAAVGVLMAGVATVPILLAQRRHIKLAAAEQAQRERQLTRLEEVLLAAPDGHFRWDSDGGEHCSRRLAVMLGLFKGMDSRFADVIEAFEPQQAAVLEVAVESLRRNGIGFDHDLALRDGRRVQIMGVRAATADGEALAEVLWVRDVTEGSQAVDELSHEASDLTAERDRLQALLDALPIPVWLRDEDLSLRHCNRAFAEAAGAADPAAALAAGSELLSGAALREARALAARARAAGTARSERFHLVIGGSRRLVELSEAPLAERPGGHLLTAGYALDQTRLEEAEAAMQRHVGAHAEVLENLGTAIAIFSIDTRLTFHNTAFRKLWGLEQEWLARQPSYGGLLDLLRERRRLPEVTDFRAYRDEEMRRFTSLIAPVEDLLHLPDGATLRRIVSPHPFGGLLFTYEDVTDVLALERSYNTTLAVHRETIDNLYEGVAVFGPDGRLRLSNPAYARIWGLDTEYLGDGPHINDLLDKHVAYFEGGNEWQDVRTALGELYQDRRPRHGRVERSDGVILDYASVPLPDGGMLKTWLDVTDSARVERALRERNEALRAADRLKSEFITNVSTEVRQPLTAVIGFAEILGEGYYGELNARQKEYVRGIIEGGRNLQNLVADILDLATIEAGKMTLSLNAFDVHSMLASVLSLTRERAREAQITVHFDCPLDIGWMVGDERRLKQVLFDLLANAIRFTPPKGQITLAAQRDGDEVVFTVADTGVGIPSGDLSGLFRPFTRGPQPPEGRQGGAGLGLSLVKSFVELHGGTVEIVSAPLEGTTVTCRLPAGQAQAE